MEEPAQRLNTAQPHTIGIAVASQRARIEEERRLARLKRQQACCGPACCSVFGCCGSAESFDEVVDENFDPVMVVDSPPSSAKTHPST